MEECSRFFWLRNSLVVGAGGVELFELMLVGE